MAITAADVNKLRTITGAGMMDCKKALEESNGDFDAAIDYLRKKGQKVAAKRADREAMEGVVIAKTNAAGDKGIIVHVTSETDFVSKNADFIKMAQEIADTAINNYPATAEDLLTLDCGGITVATKLAEAAGKIGEKIELGSYEKLEAATVVPYIHLGYRIGVLVALSKGGSEAITAIGKDTAMQIAALNAIAVDRSDVAQEILDKEFEIGRDIAIQEGKPEAMIEKIALGKVEKFLKDQTLLTQPFVKDGSKTVGQAIKEVDADLKVIQFKRVALGK